VLPRLLRDFVPERVLGRGAFGIVVAASLKEDPATRFAIKMVAWPADVDAAALGEVRAMASMPASPNLVGYCGAWVEASGEWISDLSNRLCDASEGAATTGEPFGRIDARGLFLKASASDESESSSEGSESSDDLVDTAMTSLPGWRLGPRRAAALLGDTLGATLSLTQGAGAWLFLQMELVTFPTLAHWLATDTLSGVAQSTRWRWVEGAAAGLEAVHAAGWVHNDVKPTNLFCCVRTGQTKLADFGCCVRCGSSATLGGTRAYAAPERHSSTAVAMPSSDVFSLGVVLAELFGAFSTAMERARVVMCLMAPGADVQDEKRSQAAAGPLGEASALARRMLSRYEERRPSAADVREEAASFAARASVC